MRLIRARAWGWILVFTLALAACNAPVRPGRLGQEATQGPEVEQAVPGEGGGGDGDSEGGGVFIPSVPQGGQTPGSEEVHLPAIQGGSSAQETGEPDTLTFLPQVSGSGQTEAPTTAEATTPTEPLVSLQASATQLRVGEPLTVTAQVSGIGLPYYYLHVKSPDMAETVQIARVTYDNQVTAFNNPAAQLTFSGGRGGMNEATFMLQAVQPGDLQLSVTVTGEVHLPTGGTWSGAGGGPIQIQVIQ